MRELKDYRLWADDRIHMTSEGHDRVALRAFVALGHEPAAGEAHGAMPPLEPVPWRTLLASHASWTRTHFAPWVHRRMTGRSSGDGREAKRPVPEVVDPRGPSGVGRP